MQTPKIKVTEQSRPSSAESRKYGAVLDAELTPTRSSKQYSYENKTDDLKGTGKLTLFEVPGIRRWATPHQDIAIIRTLAYRM
jgi:hypothetical protein